MKTIEWEVPKETELEKRTATVESDNEIFIKEYDGFDHYIGFIGKGEGNTDKVKISFSPSKYLKYEISAGDPIVNAERRLKLDRRTKVIDKAVFMSKFFEEMDRYNQKDVFGILSKENTPKP